VEPRVLIVDDEATLRANLAAFLEDEGMEVVTVSSGEEAIETVNKDPGFQICIMDMRLPGINGQEAIFALHASHPDLLFLIHTGTAGYSMPQELRSIGLRAEHTFKKPMSDMAPVAETIRRMIAWGGYSPNE